MRSVSRALLAGGLGLAAAFLAACGGSSGLLTPNQASAFNGLLSQASTDVSNGNCSSALNAIGTFRTQVAHLPGSVDPTLVSDLSRGADTVNALAKQQCGNTVGTGTDTGATTTTATHEQTTSTPATTSTSTSTTTPTTSTDTTPSTTTSTATTPSTPATTPSTPGTTSTGTSGGAPTGGGGGGQGNGNGNGNGD